MWTRGWAGKEHFQCCWCCACHGLGCWWEWMIMIPLIGCDDNTLILRTPLNLLQSKWDILAARHFQAIYKRVYCMQNNGKASMNVEVSSSKPQKDKLECLWCGRADGLQELTKDGCIIHFQSTLICNRVYLLRIERK